MLQQSSGFNDQQGLSSHLPLVFNSTKKGLFKCACVFCGTSFAFDESGRELKSDGIRYSICFVAHFWQITLSRLGIKE